MIPLDEFNSLVLKYGGVALVFLLGFVPVKEAGTNAWKWLFRTIGKALLQPLDQELAKMRESIDDIGKRMDAQEARLEISDVEDARRRILRFADEERHEITHSEEHFGLINDDMRLYTNYCKDHSDYQNMKADSAMDIIKAKYKEGNFLT